MADSFVVEPMSSRGAVTNAAVGAGSLVTQGLDGTLRFTELSSGEEWMSLRAGRDADAVGILQFARDDGSLYYATSDGVLRRMPTALDELVALARDRVQRDFTEAECERFFSGALYASVHASLGDDAVAGAGRCPDVT